MEIAPLRNTYPSRVIKVMKIPMRVAFRVFGLDSASLRSSSLSFSGRVREADFSSSSSAYFPRGCSAIFSVDMPAPARARSDLALATEVRYANWIKYNIIIDRKYYSALETSENWTSTDWTVLQNKRFVKYLQFLEYNIFVPKSAMYNNYAPPENCHI